MSEENLVAMPADEHRAMHEAGRVSTLAHLPDGRLAALAREEPAECQFDRRCHNLCWQTVHVQWLEDADNGEPIIVALDICEQHSELLQRLGRPV